jgi:hypothetical protein
MDFCKNLDLRQCRIYQNIAAQGGLKKRNARGTRGKILLLSRPLGTYGFYIDRDALYLGPPPSGLRPDYP